MTDESKIPTERLHVQDAENWDTEAREFAEKLIQEGKRPWFELLWPTPEHALVGNMTDEEWQDRQENLNGVGTYDAVELINGQFVTLPPYSVLKAS